MLDRPARLFVVGRGRADRVGRAVDRLVDRRRPLLGGAQPRARPLLAARRLGLLLGAPSRRPCGRSRFVVSGLVGVTLVWALLGKVVPSLGPDGGPRRPAARAGRLLERPRAARRRGARARALARARARAARCARLAALLVYARRRRAPADPVARRRRSPRSSCVALVLRCSSAAARGRAARARSRACPGLPSPRGRSPRPALVEDGAGRADRVADGRLFGVALVLGAVARRRRSCCSVPVERLVEQHGRQVAAAARGRRRAASASSASPRSSPASGTPCHWAADQVGGRRGRERPGPAHRALRRTTGSPGGARRGRSFRAHPVRRHRRPHVRDRAAKRPRRRARTVDRAAQRAAAAARRLRRRRPRCSGLAVRRRARIVGVRAALRRLDGASGPAAVGARARSRSRSVCTRSSTTTSTSSPSPGRRCSCRARSSARAGRCGVVAAGFPVCWSLAAVAVAAGRARRSPDRSPSGRSTGSTRLRIWPRPPPRRVPCPRARPALARSA